MKAEILSMQAQVTKADMLSKRANLLYSALQKIVHRSSIETCKNSLSLAVDDYVAVTPKQESLRDELQLFGEFMFSNAMANIEVKNKDRILIEAEKIIKKKQA